MNSRFQDKRLTGPVLIRIFLLLWLCHFCAVSPLRAEKTLRLDSSRKLSQLILDTWTARNNLNSSTVTSILQTREGYLWLATFNGLYRFDGITFRVFNKANTPVLKTNSFWCLHQDPAGNLWIGSNGGGLYRRKDDSFIHYGVDQGLSSPVVRSLATVQGGVLAIGTQEGLQSFNGTDFKILAGCGADENPFYTTCIASDSRGTIWLGTRNRGVARLSEQGLDFFSKETGHIGANQIYQILPRGDEMLIGTYGDGIHLWRNGEFTPFPEKNRQNMDLLITALFSDPVSNALYIGTERGIFRYQNGILDNLTTEQGLTDNTIQALCMDHESSLWIGTWRGGLCRLRTGKFLNFTQQEGLPASIVHSCAQGPDGTVWIGTQEGLALLENNSMRVLKASEGILPNGMVRHIQPMGDGTTWVSTYGGIAVLDDNLNLIKRLGKTTGLSSDLVRFSMKDSTGRIWVGTRESLNCISGDTIEVISTAQGLGNSVILSLLEDSDGSLWIGTDGGGICRLKDGKLKSFTTRDGLASDIVFRTLLSSSGDLWIASNNGLTLRRNGSFHVFTMGDGLPSDVIFQVLETSDQTLWFTSSIGLFSIPLTAFDAHLKNPSRPLLATLYGTAEGMCSPECTGVSAAMLDSQGRLWIPTLKGISVLDPGHMAENTIPPRVLVESLKTPDDNFPAPVNLILAPGTRDIQIHYTALSFAVPEKVRFSYRLLGYSDQWTLVDQRRTAYFTNLSPGSYIFQVRACNNDGVWCRESAELSFVLKPFFHQTRTFILFLCMAFGLLIYILFRLRLRHLELRRKELEEQVRIRTEKISAQSLEISRQNEENERLLLNILPRAVATRLKTGEKGIADFFPDVTILFCDIVGFTGLSSRVRAAELVSILNTVFSEFDRICISCGVEKIKTIGDGYMAAGGLPEPTQDHCHPVLGAAICMLESVKGLSVTLNQKIEIRIGIHSGPVVAGVIGSHKFIYDLWGDTVNTASRMESHGTPGSIHISRKVLEKLNLPGKDGPVELGGRKATLTARTITVKGKGEMTTFLLSPDFPDPDESTRKMGAATGELWFNS